ncbi:MAG: hypothetical protein U0V72_04330 [Cytophagales bacterium]
MKDFKITYALWLGIVFSMSSCSCCKVEVPDLTEKQKSIFSKYKIGDTILLKSDTCNLKIIVKNINTTNILQKGGGTTPCIASTTKLFVFQFINSCSQKYKNTLISRTIIVKRSKKANGSEILQFGTATPEIFYNTLQINNVLLENIHGLNFTELTLEEFPEVFYDSTGFVMASNSNRTIIYK